MDRGVYAAASGGLLQARRLQLVANNLANVSTVGFKAERLVSRQQEFADTLASSIASNAPHAKGDQQRVPGVVDIDSVTDFSPGPVTTTGNPLNVALNNKNQFFVVNTPDGERYTRAGNFTLNAQGTLVTPDGQPVLGEGGPITIQGGSNATISGNGTVSLNGASVGRLRVVEIADLNQLERADGTRFSLKGGQASPVAANVIPQSVEMPNVEVVPCMIDMISSQRSFEGYTKTLQTMDELTNLAIRNARVSG